MRIVSELSICSDCLQAIANGFDPDFCEWDSETAAAVESGLERLGPNVVCGDSEDESFSWIPCDCCERPLGGNRYPAAVLGEESAPIPAKALQCAPRPLIEQFAAAFVARANCERSGNAAWLAIWESSLEALAREHLPSGSGFDNGSTLSLDDSRPDRLIFQTSFHHMNESGFYDGWTEHRVVVTPSFIGGFDLKITGRDRRGIKDYIGESFGQALSESVIMPDT